MERWVREAMTEANLDQSPEKDLDMISMLPPVEESQSAESDPEKERMKEEEKKKETEIGTEVERKAGKGKETEDPQPHSLPGESDPGMSRASLTTKSMAHSNRLEIQNS